MSELGHLTFNEGISQLLHGLIDDGLVDVSRLEYTLSERVERGLRPIARSSSQLDGKDGVTFTHSEVGTRTGVVEYESYKFGLPFVIVSVVDGRRDTEPSV